MRVYLKTYGCTANYDDSEIMKNILAKENYELVQNFEESDVSIVNTCVVKERTSQKIFSLIKKIYASKKLIIAGCAVQSEYDRLKKFFPNAVLVDTFHVTDIIRAVQEEKKEFIGRRFEKKTGIKKDVKRIQSIQISSGCLSNCTFCQTKLAKGQLISTPIKEILQEIGNYIRQGVWQINLTSTDCSVYGLDIGTNLVELLDKIIEIPGDFKIRIGMMNPMHLKKIQDKLVKIYKNDKIIKFLHLPIQSGSDKVLQDMKRGHSALDFIEIVKLFRSEISDIQINTDIIVGYPTETEKNFKDTLQLIKKTKPDFVNVSRYSARVGTESYKLEELDVKKVKKRIKEINSLLKTYQPAAGYSK